MMKRVMMGVALLVATAALPAMEFTLVDGTVVIGEIDSGITIRASIGTLELSGEAIVSIELGNPAKIELEDGSTIFGEILDDTLSVRWAYGIVDLVVAEVASIGRARAAGRGLPLAGSLETIYVDGGTFQMGSNDGGPDDFPAHPVTVDGFHMTVTEITFAQYDAFTDATNRSSPSDRGDLDLGFRLARSEP